MTSDQKRALVTIVIIAVVVVIVGIGIAALLMQFGASLLVASIVAVIITAIIGLFMFLNMV
jgi:hypothetical protein